MRLIVEIDPPLAKGHTMTVRKLKAVPGRLETLVEQDKDLLKGLIKEALQQVLQTEMTDFLGAAPGERSEGRSGYRAGYYGRRDKRSAPPVLGEHCWDVGVGQRVTVHDHERLCVEQRHSPPRTSRRTEHGQLP